MNQAYERIDASARFDGPVRDSHELRYHVAAGFVESGDVVLDACCGTGYGRPILAARGAEYLGVDRDPPAGAGFVRVDFETGEGIQAWSFDVFVGLEAIEHLDTAGVARFLRLAHRARRAIVISTPIRPNRNPFHKQQFTAAGLVGLCATNGWRHLGTLHQSDGLYGLFVFVR